MPDLATTSSLPMGFPVELRPLLVLVIVLAIGHMVLRTRVRRGAPARRRPVQRGGVGAPVAGELPTDPAEALAALRRRADGGAPRA